MARPRKGTAKIDGQWIFADFSKGLYLLNTPRNISEQLYSLAMSSGRNCWSEKGALVAQNGYMVNATIPAEDQIVAYTRVADGTNAIFIITQSGNVYLYTALEGLKKYKTKVSPSTNPIVARRGVDLLFRTGDSNFLFGGYYAASESVMVIETTFTLDGTTYKSEIPLEMMDYFWGAKVVDIDGKAFTVISCVQEQGKTTATLRVAPQKDGDTIPTTQVSVGEKTIIPLTFEYITEATTTGSTETKTTIHPIMMEVSQNRLFLLDITGRIYYSVIGVMDNFRQSGGAGYFEGFYNDASKCLAIEDFLTGTLIVKEGGFYYLTINSSTSATGSVIYTVDIKKISNAGQQYATDHVTVGEKVYAYDCNTGAIVNAVSVNVFGSLVSGKPIISSEYLNARAMGINSVKRSLTYNSESEVFILYYGENLNNGLVLTTVGTLFPRQLDKEIKGYIGFNQGVLMISKFGEIGQDFIKGTVIPNIQPEVTFEAIGLRDNRMICSSILELTELNGVSYDVSTRNACSSYQKVVPTSGNGDIALPPFLYSDFKNNIILDSYSLDTQWASLKSNVTRISAPMSGREGIALSLTFPANTAFCLSALRLPDFSQGE